ncbi:hypothetical protein Ssi03_32330 [Sphaerisporangium siamense]|nr:hypothetical protein Ssi03_32330 [Sphaerisporangium siamense]
MYVVILDPIAEEQIAALPEQALSPLAELFTLLETAPWSGRGYDPANPKGNMLTHTSANAAWSRMWSWTSSVRRTSFASSGPEDFSAQLRFWPGTTARPACG